MVALVLTVLASSVVVLASSTALEAVLDDDD